MIKDKNLTELELYKWVVAYEPEYRWDKNGANGKEDVIVWVTFWALDSFCKLFPYSLFDEGGIEVRLQDRCIVIWASDFCGYMGIELENIFKKED